VKPPKNFPCRGWRGCEEAVDFAGLLEGINVLRPTYYRWVGRHDPDVVNQVEQELHAGEGGLPHEALVGGGALVPVGVPVALGPPGHAVAGPIPANPVAQAPGAAAYAVQQGEQSKYRETAIKFIREKPLVALLILRAVMGCFARYVDKLLYFSSDKFKLRHLYNMVKEMAPETASSSGSALPKFPVFVAFRAKEELELLETIVKLLRDPECWQAIPAASRTSKWCCWAFRMLSCAGCMNVDGNATVRLLLQ